MSEDHDFKKKADAILALLSRELAGAADDYGFKSTTSGGNIQVECGSGKMSIGPNPQAEQIVLQVPGRTYKLDWDVVEASFVHSDSGRSLRELVEQTLSKLLRQEVTL